MISVSYGMTWYIDIIWSPIIWQQCFQIDIRVIWCQLWHGAISKVSFRGHNAAGFILGKCSIHERWRYIETSPFISWIYNQNDPWCLGAKQATSYCLNHCGPSHWRIWDTKPSELMQKGKSSTIDTSELYMWCVNPLIALHFNTMYIRLCSLKMYVMIHNQKCVNGKPWTV